MLRNKDFSEKNKKFFSTGELASMLGVSRIAVFKKIKSGAIRAEKTGRNYFIPREELDAIIGVFVPETKKMEIDASVEKTVREFGDALRRLGKE